MEELRERCLNIRWDDYIRKRDVFHVTVSISNIAKFRHLLEDYDRIYKIAHYADHVHMIIESHHEWPADRNVRVEAVRDREHKFRIFRIQHGRSKHDVLCDVTFPPPSLMDACVRRIVNDMRSLREVRKLRPPALPFSLFQYVFQRGKSYVELPPTTPLEREEFLRKFRPENAFRSLDRVLDKKFVAWIQKRELPLFGYDFPNPLQFLFRAPSRNYDLKMCLECVKLELETCNEALSFQRYYYIYDRFWANYEDPLSWCHACKVVPLFQLLTNVSFLNEYHLSNRGSPIFPRSCRRTLKIEYFREGTLKEVLYPPRVGRN